MISSNTNLKWWHEYILEHTWVDFSTGDVYWTKSAPGRRVDKPIGCRDLNGYIKTSVACIACYCHQIVFLHFYGYWPEMIDHDNRNRSDNRPENLIETNHSKNALNSKLWETNTTGVKGVSYTNHGKFKVTVKGKFYGYFNTLAEAKEIADGCYT